MALTGNKLTGQDLAISIGGTALEQAVVRGLSFNKTKDVHDSTGGGGGAKTYIGGETGATVSFDLWSTTSASDVQSQFDFSNDTGVAVILYPVGNATGVRSISFSAIWTSMSEPIEKNSVVGVSVSGQVTGAVTDGLTPSS